MLEQGGSWDTYLSLIEFTFALVLGCPISKHCMVGDVKHLCVV